MEIAGCISEIAVLVGRCIRWSLGSSNADDMKDAVLRCNSPASLFCSWLLHLDRKKSPIVLYNNAFPFSFNLCKNRSCIREELIKCDRLQLLCHRLILLSHSIA